MYRESLAETGKTNGSVSSMSGPNLQRNRETRGSRTYESMLNRRVQMKLTNKTALSCIAIFFSLYDH